MTTKNIAITLGSICASFLEGNKPLSLIDLDEEPRISCEEVQMFSAPKSTLPSAGTVLKRINLQSCSDYPIPSGSNEKFSRIIQLMNKVPEDNDLTSLDNALAEEIRSIEFDSPFWASAFNRCHLEGDCKHTILQHIFHHGLIESAKALQSRGYSSKSTDYVFTLDKYGQNLLHLAVLSGQEEMISYLASILDQEFVRLVHGVEACRWDGLDPYSLALTIGRQDMASKIEHFFLLFAHAGRPEEVVEVVHQKVEAVDRKDNLHLRLPTLHHYNNCKICAASKNVLPTIVAQTKTSVPMSVEKKSLICYCKECGQVVSCPKSESISAPKEAQQARAVSVPTSASKASRTLSSRNTAVYALNVEIYVFHCEICENYLFQEQSKYRRDHIL
eukprot:GHVP01059384.1.p1 GENE.GHVP01059384.1~~GHVP01059384.1.p1  ORF type:complete len:388 (+),score=55.58 GHVP01059384.1:67-1230(+)